jgi:hypothetical protein
MIQSTARILTHQQKCADPHWQRAAQHRDPKDDCGMARFDAPGRRLGQDPRSARASRSLIALLRARPPAAGLLGAQ